MGKSWRSLPPCLPNLSPFMISFLSGLLLACLPSLSLFMISLLGCLGCSWQRLPRCLKLVSLHDFSSGLLLAAAAALSPKLVSLHDFPSGCSWLPLAALSPKLVSLQDLSSGLVLAAAWRLVSQACLSSGSPFWAALGSRAAAAALSPKLVSLHDFLSFWVSLGCRCRRFFQACPPL